MFEEDQIFTLNANKKCFVAELRGLPIDLRFSSILDSIESSLSILDCRRIERTYDSLVIMKKEHFLMNMIFCKQLDFSFFLISIKMDLQSMTKKIKFSSSPTDSATFKRILSLLENVVSEMKRKNVSSSKVKREEERKSENYEVYKSFLSISRAVFSLNYSIGKKHCEYLANFDFERNSDFKNIAEYQKSLLDSIIKDYNSGSYEINWIMSNGSELIDLIYGQLLLPKIFDFHKEVFVNQKPAIAFQHNLDENTVKICQDFLLLFLKSSSLLEKISILEEMYFCLVMMTGLKSFKGDYLLVRSTLRSACLNLQKVSELRSWMQILHEFMAQARVEFESDEFLIEILTVLEQ